MDKVLKLRDHCVVYIDWANVHGWKKSLKREIDPKKLHAYFQKYKEIQQARFYYGTDTNPKSRKFLKLAKEIGFFVVTKSVKYITVGVVGEKELKRRKCDFDMEMCIDVHKDLAKEVDGFIFFTGDGDFEPLYKLLIEKHKQVIVVYMHGHLGREIYMLNKGLYKISIERLEKLEEVRLAS